MHVGERYPVIIRKIFGRVCSPARRYDEKRWTSHRGGAVDAACAGVPTRSPASTARFRFDQRRSHQLAVAFA
jgi:hypothetical protein